MQETKVLKIEELNSDTVLHIEELYEDFKLKASSVYKFEIPPLEYEDFKTVINENLINGLVLYEDSNPAGFLLYVLESHKAIELNLIHIANDENINTKRMELIKALLKSLEDRTDWNVISYPMLGVQETFVKDLAWLGFKLIGQAIVKFKFDNLISYKIFTSLELPELPEGYVMTTWNDEYFEQASQAIHDTFKTASDANFDPRFLSLDGSKEITHRIITNVFGLFLPECTSVLLYNGEVAGICFANITNVLNANVPLIGVKKEHKNKGFGKYLLKNTVGSIIKHLQEGKIYASEVNAAVETDNFPALRMYRKIGFREEYTYPHAYRKNPNYKEE